MASIEQKSHGKQEKTGSLAMNMTSVQIPYRHETYRKISSCGHFVKKCLGQEVRPSVGLCMIAFAVPLIVPGITLTVVAFENQSGFPKYGALHVLGMVLLGLAVVLIVTGILLNTRSKLKIASDDVQLVESNQEKSAKEININNCVTSSTDEYHHTSHNMTSGLTSKLPSYNSVVKLCGESPERYPEVKYTTAEVNSYSDTDKKHGVFKTREDTERKYSSSKSVEECSSSFDSFDSDDYSAGSYILSEDIEGQKSIQAFDFTMGYVHENDDVRLFSTFKQDNVKKHAFSFDNINSDYTAGKSSAVSLPSVHNRAFILQDAVEDVQPAGNLRNKMALIFDNINKLQMETETTKLPPNFPSELSVEANSPASRQRLHGLSSEACTTSSDMLATSSDVFKFPDVVSSENISASNPSVFSLDLVVKSVKDTAQGDRKELDMFTRDTEPLPQKTWAQSPSTSRPHSFPCGGGISLSGLPAAVVRIHSLNDTYVTSLPPSRQLHQLLYTTKTGALSLTSHTSPSLQNPCLHVLL